MNNKNYCVYDLESDNIDRYIAQPIQISSIIVEPMHLTIIPDSEFDGYCRPDGFDKKDYLIESRLDTYKFHAENKGCTLEEMLEKVGDSPPLEMVFKQWVEYVRGYADKPGSKSLFQAPINVGFNNISYDDHIVRRLCGKYKILYKGEPSLFFWRDSQDVMKIVYNWFEGSSDSKLPKNLKLDTLRPLFKINAELKDAHSGIQDCKDTAELYIRFAKLHRHFYNNVKWPWKVS